MSKTETGKDTSYEYEISGIMMSSVRMKGTERTFHEVILDPEI